MADNTVIHSIEFTGDASKLQDACEKAAKAVSGLGNSLNSDSKKIDSVSNSLSTMTNKVSGLFSSLGATLSVASFGLFIKSALQASAQLEQTAVSFEIFTGSADTATKLLAEFKNQALSSPMQFQDITKGAQTLLGYGLTAEQVIPITKMLGDISGGNADRFSRLSLAFGQVTAAGRLMGQEARQMINAGFNPLQSISDKTGESMASLSQRMHDGKISVQEVANAFSYATSEGGRFFGLSERQAETLQGKFNKLSESVTFSMAEIGNSISSNLNLASIVDNVSYLINKLTDSFVNLNQNGGGGGKAFGEIINASLSAIAMGIDLTIRLLGKLSSAFNELYQVVPKAVGVLDTMDNILIAMTKDMPLLNNALVTTNDYFNSFFDNKNPKKDIEPFKMKPLFEDLTKLKSELKDLNEKSKNYNLLGIDTSQTLKPEIDKKVEMIAKLQKEYDKYYAKLFSNQTKGGGNEISKEEQEAQRQYERDLELMKRAHEKALEENYKLQEKLIGIEKDTNFKIETLNLSAEDKALADLKNEFENKKKVYEEGNRSIINIETLYNEQREKLQREFAYKRTIKANQDLKDETEGLKSEYPKRLSDFYNEFLNTDIQGKIGNYAQSVYSAIKDLNINLASGVAELAGTALATGMSMADTFKAFGAIILNALGDVLIKIGTSAIAAGMVGTALKAFFSGGISTIPELGIAGGIAAVTIGSAMKALSGNIKNAQSDLGNKSTGLSTPTTRTSGMTSGSSYQYGGSSYSTQSMKLSIDLTGSITQTQTGYSINKSLETVLRVTGR